MPDTLEKQRTAFVLIAGQGEIPIKLIRSALKAGKTIKVIAIDTITYKKSKELTETYKYSLFEIFQIIEKIKELGIKDICFIGKFPKSDFFKNLHKFDKRILELIKNIQNLNDDSIHLALTKLLEEEYELKVVDQTKYLQDCFSPEQSFTNRELTNEELEEVDYGLKMAKEIARLDIGQTVIVKNKAVLAVEAIEGTNKCIKRAGSSFFGFFKKSITVCKVEKPQQDKRFDVPAVGLQTIQAMNPGSILAFEANKVFFLDQEKSIKLANKKSIVIISRKL